MAVRRVVATTVTAVVCVLVILSSIFPIPEYPSIGTPRMVLAQSWLSGWSYRKQISINGSAAGVQTNYTMELTVHAGVGTDSGGDVYLGSGNETSYNISVSSSDHTDFGLGYPVTYIFDIPAASTNLTAHKRYSQGDSWDELTERTPTDFFNGIEYVRFNYTSDKAYIGVAFSNATDNIYVQVRDSEDDPVAISYDEIPEYYDDRQCAVTVTADDWAESSDEGFDTACNHCQSRSIWFTGGIITQHPSGVPWAGIQEQLDEGYLEAAGHSQTHPTIPYGDYDAEIGGCRDDITVNLTLPSIYTSGSSEYVWGWFEPYGDSDATVRSKLGTYNYLGDRDITTDHTWSSWDSSNSLYHRIGYSIRIGGDGEEDLATLNASFDARYSAGGIYNMMMHPGQVNWDSYGLSHLDHIGDRNDVWYVGFGAMYMYHYVDEQAVATIEPVNPRCQNDFDDIRFTQSDGSTELDFWKEEYTASTNATFWVEFNSIPASPDSATFYMYYGNTTASYPTYANTTAQGQATFIEFDDFERGSDEDEIGGNWSEVSGTVEISTAQAWSGSGNRSMKLEGAATQPAAQIARAVSGSDGIAIRYRLYKETSAKHRFYFVDSARQIFWIVDTNDDIEYYDTGYHKVGDATADTWELYEINDIDFSSGYNYDMWHKGSEIKADASMRTVAGTPDKITLYGLNSVGLDSWIDDFIIRTWCDPEPTWGTWGSEETETVCSPSISLNTSSWDANGGVEVSTSSNYSSGLTYFTITNNSGGAVDITIGGVDMTGGGYTWDLADDGSAGDMIVALYAGREGEAYNIIVRETASYNTLVAGLADSGTQSFGLTMCTPTNFDDGNDKSGTVTLTVVCS